MKPDTFLLTETTSNPMEWLSSKLDIPTMAVEELFQLGSIYIDGVRHQNCSQLLHGQVLRIFLTPRRFPIQKLNVQNQVFEDEQLLVIDKPAGIPSIPTSSNAVENTLSWAQEQCGHKLYPLHRLDEATRGLLMFSKTAKLVKEYHQQRPKIEKIYLCHTLHPVKPGYYEHFLFKNSGKMQISPSNEGLRAQLQVIQCEKNGDVYLHRIRLLTGRTHQIRCQMAELGAPILGDCIYGNSNQNSLQLLAHSIQWKKWSLRSRMSLD